MLGSLLLASSSHVKALSEGNAKGELESKASRIAERVLHAFWEADAASLAALPMSPVAHSGVTYAEVTSVSPSTGVVTTRTNRIQFEYDPRDPNDGLDNDGDGVIDEGRVVLIQNFGGGALQRTTVLGNGVREYLEGEIQNGADDNGNGLVDERGFCLTWNGVRMGVRVSLERVDTRGARTISTMTDLVRVMN
jgi:hypothetical protein